MTGRLVPYGERAILVELDALQAVLGLYAALTEDPPDGIVDIVPAARTVTVVFDPARVAAAVVRAWLERTEPADAAVDPREPVTIDVDYSGEDLADVARTLGLSAEEVVDIHTSSAWRVAFTGFSPGFGYLTTDHGLLTVPRRESPRTRVPAGSVALAGEFCGIYPRPSPGGWRLIGSTERTLWDSDREEPALLTPGRSVRFRRIA